MFTIPVWLQHTAVVFFGLVLIINLLSLLCKPGKTVTHVQVLSTKGGCIKTLETRVTPSGKVSKRICSRRIIAW